MTIEIKPIQPHQITDAKRLIVTVAEGIMHWGKTIDELLETFKDELRDVDDVQSHYLDRRGTFLVSLEKERVIGTGAIRPIDDKVCELKRMWLLEEYHGKDIGYRMMQRLLEFARQTGYASIRLQTGIEQERAIKFYHRIGFRDVAHLEHNETEIIMEMSLE